MLQLLWDKSPTLERWCLQSFFVVVTAAMF